MSEQQTTQDESTLPFAGLTSYNDAMLPEDVFGHGTSMRWWAEERWGEEDDEGVQTPDRSFNTLIDQLPRATTANVYWEHPLTGEMFKTDKHNALIDPDRAERIDRSFGTQQEALDAGVTKGELKDTTVGDDALYYVPTDDYTIINPASFLRPLAEVVRDQELGDAMFGEARLFRAGGKVSLDVFFDGKHVEVPGREENKPVVLGLQIDWDFFGGTSVHAQGMGMDWECINALRSITDKVTVKHRGDVDQRVDWHSKWESLLEEIDLKIDYLAQMIAQAMEDELDLSELPNDFAAEYDTILEALYAYAGLPDYLAEVAANNCRANAADPFSPSWWDIHSGATYAITHHSRSDTHSASQVERQNRIANDMLFNPNMTVETVIEEYEEQQENERLSEEGVGKARILAASRSVQENREEYEERAETMRALQANADDPADA